MKLEKIPSRIRARIGKTEKIQTEINNFFLNTKGYLEKQYGKFPCFEKHLENFSNSDSHLHYLTYNNQMVAGVIERRTDFNNLGYIFFRNLDNLKLQNPANPINTSNLLGK